MYINDDRETAKLGDRLIAAVVAGFCGYLIGWIFALVTFRIFGSQFGLTWILPIGSAAFAFVAPARSRDLWSAFWEELLGFLSGR